MGWDVYDWESVKRYKGGDKSGKTDITPSDWTNDGPIPDFFSRMWDLGCGSAAENPPKLT